MSDSLDDRLSKQKTAVDAKRQAYLKAMRQRAAKIEADNLAQRIPRAETFFEGLKTEIVRRITDLAARDADMHADDAMAPLQVPAEFDGSKSPDLDVRLPEDTAHATWLTFSKWGSDNGLKIEVTEVRPAHITVSVG